MSAMFRIEMQGQHFFDRSDAAMRRGAVGGRTVFVVHIVNHFQLPHKATVKWSHGTALRDPYVAIYRALKRLRLIWAARAERQRVERAERFGPLFGLEVAA